MKPRPIAVRRSLNPAEVLLTNYRAAGLVLLTAAVLCFSSSAFGDEIWTLADSPIVIDSTLVIPPTTTVTVEPGVEVRLQNGALLVVEGALIGDGTAGQPINILGGSTSFVYIEVPGSLTLSHAVMDVQVRPKTGGSLQFSDTTFESAAVVSNYGVNYFLSLERCVFNGAYLWVGAGTIRMTDVSFIGNFASIGNSMLRMDNVSSTASSIYGIALHDFEQPVYVDAMSVSGAAAAGIDLVAGNFLFGDNISLSANQYPVQLGGAGILPGSVLPATGNVNDHIRVEFASNGAWSAVWADPGIPYAMVDGQYHSGTLEILPGVTVLLEPNFTFWDDNSVVDARGLPDNPVRFAPLIPGQTWQGLQYFHRFENCIIEGGQVGARFHSSTGPGYIDNCIIQNNDFGTQNNALVRKTRFYNNVVGAWGSDYPLGLQSQSNPNSFVGNGMAIEIANNIVDASYNWFGSPSGPTTPANPGGTGDSVEIGVEVMPFLTSEPDFNDHPPVLRLLQSPRRENASMSYSSFVDPGTAVIVHWGVQDEGAIASQRIEFFNGGENTWSVVTELPGDQRSYEWVVPDVGLIVNGSSNRLRIIAIDAAGQEGWDEHQYFIPTGVEPGTLAVTGLQSGPFQPGDLLGTICNEAIGTDPFHMVDYELSFDGDQWHIPLGSNFAGGCLVLTQKAPFVSTDTARIRVNTQGGLNQVKYFFSDYFTIRPDPRLGDDAPSVTLISPGSGASYNGGSLLPISWTATDDEGIRSTDIQISTDGGRTWHFIAEDLAPTVTSLDWRLPPSNGIADTRVRVMVSDLHYQTATDGGETSFQIVAGMPDIDQDNVDDSIDNCTLVANPNQRDTDADGYGNFCDPDLDNNGQINFTDLSQFQARFFTTDPHADLDGNGTVNFADLVIVKSMFFGAPGPSALNP